MVKTKKGFKIVASVLAASVILSIPMDYGYAATAAGKPAGATYAPVQLHAAPTKEMTYYKTGDASIPGNINWVTTKTELVFLPATAIGDVTAVTKDSDGTYWIGTTTGLQRVNFTEADERDIVQYMAGPRYLYGGDDSVQAVASDNAGGVWVKTASGVTHIAMPKKTLLDKTVAYERLMSTVADRRGMVTGTGFTFNDPANTSINYNSPTGVFSSNPSTSDNDGLWTTMYAIGEIFRYKALREENAPQAEIDKAKAAALKASKAVLFLDYVSGRGNGFPARSYMLTSEAGAQTTDGTDYGFQSTNGFWFHTVMGQPDPNNIVTNGALGYSIARVTDDSLTKSGDKLFTTGGTDVMNYNGIALSQAKIDQFNAVRPVGQKLGVDIKTSVETNVYQVLPVITAATNLTVKSKDHTTTAANKPVFQLTVPVLEQIPQFFNDLFPASVIGQNGYIDQNQIVYKADTSSDEVDGHYALFFSAYKYLCDDNSDPKLVELKHLIAQATDRMTNLILKDGAYGIEDATGKMTQWSKWSSKYFNDNIDIMENQPLWQKNVGVDANGDDALSYGYEDGPLNVLEMMAALKTAIYVTAEEYPLDQARFKAEYDKSYASSYSKKETFENGKGYIHMALEYIKRRLVRQATSAYDENGTVVTQDAPGYANKKDVDSNINATIHDNWTQYINYSDEELGWFPVYQLLVLETDPARHAQIVAAYDQWFANEVREENPFYTFLYQLAHPTDTTVDLQSAVRFLYRMPEYRVEFPAQFVRQDVFYIENGYRDKYTQVNYALAPDERTIIKDNSNPFATNFNGSTVSYAKNANYNYKAGTMEGASVFLLPYWLGRYFGMIQE